MSKNSQNSTNSTNQINYDEIPYKLVRSKRKTLALTVDSDAQLVIRAPLKLDEKIIQDFVRKKHRWITEKQRQMRYFGEKQSPFILADGENVLYCGKSYAILLYDSEVSEVTIDGNFMKISKNMEITDFASWLRSQAASIIGERVEYYANLMGAKYASVKMSDARQRWGSCSAKNSLNFAWRLVMCPLFVVDYVVVHELTHIEYKDHSERFWRRLSSVLPDYRAAQDWLRFNRRLMEVV
ncbi:MAG: M48 family metallopeptidase [Firmicutes bacterium]|nr:M48 family metallopeptidase [Bacillota bacterium]